MMVVQLQLPVAPQGLPTVSRQTLPMQHGLVVEQVCPAPGHTDIWQVPTLAPLGLLQARPEQQSADAVQAWFSGEHSWAGWQMFAPPSVEVQMPAQHSAEAAQVVPFDLHTPASATVPPSAAGGIGSRQANVVDSSLMDAAQTVPAQQVLPAPPSAAAQLAPSAEHVTGGAQVSPVPPSPFGKHGEPPQHWSLNWHDWPAPMQQGATPV